MPKLNKSILWEMAFLAISICAEAESRFNEYPVRSVFIPEINNSPIVDGNLNEEAWKKATSFPSFVRTAGERTGEVADYKTECYAFRNGSNLFVAFVCHDTDIKKLCSGITGWDNTDIIYDDRVEIFIDTDHDHRNYFELAVNPKGIQFDQKLFLRYPKTRTNENDPAWNCKWKARTTIFDDRWIAEIEIDATTMGIDRIEDGTTWGFNVARARRPDIPKGQRWRILSGETEYSAWCITRDGIWETLSNFQEPIDFGDLVFGKPDAGIKKIRFRNASFVFGGNNVPPSNVGNNPLEIQFDRPLNMEAGLLLYLKTTSPNGKIWETENDIATDSSDSFTAGYFIHESEENRLDIEVRKKENHALVYRTAYVLTVPPFIDFDLSSLYLREAGNCNPVSFRLLADQLTLDRSSLEIRLYDENENLIGERTIPELNKTDDFQNLFSTDSLSALPGGNFCIQNALKDKNTGEIISSFIQPFTRFEFNASNEFKAIEGPYRYAGMEGNAVQVLFPNRQRYVFWEKASNVPWWDVGQVALTYEFVESNGFTTQGCTEAMQDRQCRYSKVRIVENSPARVVIHWRYALTDAHYRIHNNEWVDEYYRFYPDGVGVREVNLWANGNEIHEFFEIIPVNPPAMQEKDMFNGYVARVSDLAGGSYTTDDFNEKGNSFREDFFKKGQDFLVEVNLKNRMHPFAVFTCRDSVNPGVSYKTITLCPPREYGLASHRAHWPASQYDIDGYNLIGNHRPSHGNIGSIKSEVDPLKNPNRFTVLLGIDQPDSDFAYESGCSWLNPGKVLPKTSPLCYQKYDINQRAYLFEPSPEDTSLRFILKPEGKAITNPVFIIKGIDTGRIKRLIINGKLLYEGEYQTGTSQENECIIFVNRTIDKSQSIEIEF